MVYVPCILIVLCSLYELFIKIKSNAINDKHSYILTITILITITLLNYAFFVIFFNQQPTYYKLTSPRAVNDH
jgi:hypothetical protein